MPEIVHPPDAPHLGVPAEGARGARPHIARAEKRSGWTGRSSACRTAPARGPRRAVPRAVGAAGTGPRTDTGPCAPSCGRVPCAPRRAARRPARPPAGYLPRPPSAPPGFPPVILAVLVLLKVGRCCGTRPAKARRALAPLAALLRSPVFRRWSRRLRVAAVACGGRGSEHDRPRGGERDGGRSADQRGSSEQGRGGVRARDSEGNDRPTAVSVVQLGSNRSAVGAGRLLRRAIRCSLGGRYRSELLPLTRAPFGGLAFTAFTVALKLFTLAFTAFTSLPLGPLAGFGPLAFLAPCCLFPFGLLLRGRRLSTGTHR